MHLSFTFQPFVLKQISNLIERLEKNIASPKPRNIQTARELPTNLSTGQQNFAHRWAE
jgi:hypothetical protein